MLILFGLCLAVLTACATPARKTTGEVIVGMSADQVFVILGDPAKRSNRENYEAWRYEDIVRIKPCTRRNSGCRRACKHTMVWFYRNVVASMTSLHVSDVARCEQGSDPVSWDLFPDYAFLCYRNRLDFPAVSELCVG